MIIERTLAFQCVLIACAWAITLWFYAEFFSIHQDLAGGALTGSLAVELGESFANYSTYFPPAEWAWFEFAARVSNFTGMRLDLVVVLMTNVAATFSAFLAYFIRKQTVGASSVFLLAPLVLLLLLPILFKNVFGLREHLVALGFWPYIVLRYSDPDGTHIGRKARVVIGLWLGATLLFKYLYSIAVFLLEVADAIARRNILSVFRLENLIAGTMVIAYLFVWLVLDPSQRMAIAAMRSAIDANLVSPSAGSLNIFYRLLLAAFFLVSARIFRWPMRETAIGLALVIGAVIVSAIQARWYSHHIFPITLAYIVWWWLVKGQMQAWAHAVVAILVAMPILPQTLSNASYQAEVREFELALSEAGVTVTGQRVGTLAVHPSPLNQYLAAHHAQRWNTSVNIAYVASELSPFDRPENSGLVAPPVKLDDPGRRLLHDEMLRLWEDMPPDAIILDYSKSWPLRHVQIDWLRAFADDDRFNAILANYRPVMQHEGERLKFTYYVRIE